MAFRVSRFGVCCFVEFNVAKINIENLAKRKKEPSSVGVRFEDGVVGESEEVGGLKVNLDFLGALGSGGKSQDAAIFRNCLNLPE